MFLSNLVKKRKFRNACIGEDDVKPSFCFYGLIKTIKVVQFGNVALNTYNVGADCFYGLIKLLLAAARDEYVSPPFHEELCCSQPYPGCATGNHCYFSLQVLSFGHQ